MSSESNTRSLLKAISWRIIASIITTIIAYSFGLPAKAIGMVFFADLIVKFILLFSLLISSLLKVSIKW